jgi:deoxycytidylate deaminase
MAEVRALRERFSKSFLIAVHASRSIRWSRIQGDYDGNQKDFDRDDARDAGEGIDHGQQVSRCVDAADYVFLNETPNDYSSARNNEIWSRLEQDLFLMRDCDGSVRGSLSKRRPPRPDEAQMATAYAQLHISQCLKRHVGAVIVDARERVLSVGYNENPINMLPCVSRYQRCFKDADMFAKLEAMRDVRCPKCGQVQGKLSDPWLCNGCKENLKLFFFPDRNMTLCTAIQAEEQAIQSLEGRSAEGGTIYSTTFPCFQCARYIINAGIKKVVYVEAYPVKESKAFLEDNGLSVVPFSGFKARAFSLVFRQVE